MSEDTFEQSILNKNRLDKFVLVINLPPLLKDINKQQSRTNSTIQLDKLAFSVYGVVAPRISVPAIGVGYSGNVLHVSSHVHPAYTPVNVNFTVDNRFNNYWMIFKWLNALRDARNGTYDIANDGKKFNADMLITDYATDFTLYGKDEYDKNVIKWTYKHAFPTELAEISYNYRTSNEIESSFTFAFAEVFCELL